MAPETLIPDERNLIRIGITNPSPSPLEVTLESIETRLGVSGIVFNQPFALRPGETKYFPLRLRVPRGSADSLFQLCVLVKARLRDSVWTQTVTDSLPVALSS
ncbi:MAG: hypothetical protein FWJ85_13380, partial [Solitalea sp.]